MTALHQEMRKKAAMAVEFNRFAKVNRFCGMTNAEYRARQSRTSEPPQCWPCCDQRERDSAGLVEGSRHRCDTCPVHPSRIDGEVAS